MTYFIDLFSPETYETFSKSDRSISGFRSTQSKSAERVRPGDKFICYMTKLSRWVGVLEVLEGPFTDDTPIFYEADDPFVVRFRVRPLVWLEKEYALPIKQDRVWSRLTFTRNEPKKSYTWTGQVRRSLNEMQASDGELLEELLAEQAAGGETYPIDDREYRKLVTHRVRTQKRTVAVTVPEEEEDSDEEQVPDVEVRDSIQIQALLADIGAKMGFSVWIPRSDRSRVEKVWNPENPPILDLLPLNYDDTTLKTIEQIDVLWLRGRAIARAFEVEHTTSVYSGILRMADLLALQPNMDIRLHIVAPSVRRDKVFTEIRRPVFSLLERGPLADSCTYIAYDSVRELANEPHLTYLSDAVLDEYTEQAE